MRGLGIAAMSIMLGLTLCIGWYWVAANYDYSALAGTYTVTINGDSWLLRLQSDQTFTEQVTRSGRTQTVQGEWGRFGEAHVSFSSAFIPLPGEELGRSGEAHGQFDKLFGLWPSLTLAPIPNGPTLHKRLFRGDL